MTADVTDVGAVIEKLQEKLQEAASHVTTDSGLLTYSMTILKAVAEERDAAIKHRDIMKSILTDIGKLLGVFSIDGQEYISGVKALMAGHKMPYYQIIEAERNALLEVVAFYAEPATYHAIMFVPDPPAGEFMEDFSEDHGDDFYERPMPGKRARAVLEKFADPMNIQMNVP